MSHEFLMFALSLAAVAAVILIVPPFRKAVAEGMNNSFPILVFILCLQQFGGCNSKAHGAEPQIDMDQFLKCLHMKEASGQLKPEDGDSGLAIGPYQIHRKYWKDAVDHDPSIGGTYQDCRKKEYAEKIVRAYLDRWATKKRLGHSVTYEDLARVHNGGGPRCWYKHSKHWLWKKATTGYWNNKAFDPVR